MRELLLGTHNLHKAEEISRLLSTVPYHLKTLNDYPQVRAIEEDGQTLEENALKKAKAYAKLTGLLTIADDTGLEVDALGGIPGIFSARYAGEHSSYKDNNEKLLKALEHKKEKQRNAKFRCVVACYDPATHHCWMVEGALHGQIIEEMRGSNGFGYDPIFFIPELGKTLAELTMEEKNRLSHRAKAILKAKEALQFQCAKGS